ncbi:hypothetical protein ACQQ2N_04125 [Dokdonella sp. MW10]|uniref:hypothetical protein n=1 Tax=Dokdonella sp. MW10 TaxID=2992926 RepID=UPI003F7EFA31
MHAAGSMPFYRRLVAACAMSLGGEAAALEVGMPGVATATTLKLVHERKRTPNVDPRDAPKLALTVPVHTRLEIEFSHKRREILRRDGEDSRGEGDAEIKVKWAALPRDARGRAVAIEAKLMLPTGNADEGLGAGEVRLNLAVLAGRLDAQGGFSTKFAYERGANASRGEITAGIARVRRWGAFEGGVEVYAKAHDDAFDRAAVFAGVGVKWRPRGPWEVHAVGARSLHREAGVETKTKFVVQYRF